MSEPFGELRAIVLDWAGTTIDHGSRAPAFVFREIFRNRGVEVTFAQAREPMGMAKRDHIAAVAAMPDVARSWEEKHGGPIDEADIDALYDDFLPLQKSILGEHTDVIAGMPEVVGRLRERGLRIGSSTGYTRELMEIVVPAARSQGYEPDSVLCVEDAPRGRPAPYLLYRAATDLDVFPLWRIVKVDDTPVGIEAGRNAGCWTIGVTLTGNGVGLSADELAATPPDEVARLRATAADRLLAAGAHTTIDSVANVEPVLDAIDARLRAGERPDTVERLD